MKKTILFGFAAFGLNAAIAQTTDTADSYNRSQTTRTQTVTSSGSQTVTPGTHRKSSANGNYNSDGTYNGNNTNNNTSTNGSTSKNANGTKKTSTTKTTSTYTTTGPTK